LQALSLPAATTTVTPALCMRIGEIFAPLATPWVVPATVPATRVPWPLQSLVPLPAEIAV
jgi:hypothetical protein